eukprot:TRINITY_DN12608_c0_g1_i2.p1 TRINITY_DN12608_c0_g1~~TRINITY_DN12608_c0_g1_i2.p1  ORF type:complete len:735 (+),score=313.05 TRINITY_DN12608_c0_g1_i2:46-2205(+)
MPIKVLGAEGENVEVTPLGSGKEVGRSAVVVKFRDKQVLFDCGIHPAKSGLDSLPFFDAIDTAKIDLCLITHFHLDHCGAVPYFIKETKFDGKVVMTHPTRKIFRMVMQDFMRVTSSGAQKLCTDQWLDEAMDSIETLDYHQEGQHNGIRYHSYNAGHVLGAGMWMVEISGVRILYTGDFSREADRHLLGAETPLVQPDILIVESTYGINVHDKREEREQKFCKWVSDIVLRGGRCLLPVFAIGRAQELLLILDEYWSEHKEVQNIPIYYASSLAKKCNTVFESYINLMNDRVREQYDVLKHRKNPFVFQHITLLKDLHAFDDNGPSVVMASPGMLQSGLSLELFEKWCPEERNGVVISGYCVEGTNARSIQSNPRDFQRQSGKVVPLRCSIHTVSFSAHSDYEQTREFVRAIGTKHAVLVHGDALQMGRLAERLPQDMPHVSTYTPDNGRTISIPVNPQLLCRVVGGAAENARAAQDNSTLSGVMVVSKDDTRTLLLPQDIATFTELPVARISQSVYVPLTKYFPVSDVKDHLSVYFAGVSIVDRVPDVTHEKTELGGDKLLVGSSVTVGIEHATKDGEEVTLANITWESTRYSDIIADSCCLALVALAHGTKQKLPQEAADEAFRLRCLHKMLGQHFLGVHLDLSTKQFTFESNGIPIKVTAPFAVESGSEVERRRVETVLYRSFLALYPLPDNFGWCGCGGHEDAGHIKKRRLVAV